MTKEEKDKLIVLSDLNRKDNIKYISSEAQGIAITLDSDRYAPTFCKLERAYICGRRKSEEQIAELEKAYEETQELLDKQIEATYKLDKENTELKEKLTAVRNAKDKYDMSKNKSIIKAFGAEYTLFCDLERILEDWYEDDKLTKAKEIIKEFLLWENDWRDKTESKYELLKQAEQFLSEVEK